MRFCITLDRFKRQASRREDRGMLLPSKSAIVHGSPGHKRVLFASLADRRISQIIFFPMLSLLKVLRGRRSAQTIILLLIVLSFAVVVFGIASIWVAFVANWKQQEWCRCGAWYPSLGWDVPSISVGIPAVSTMSFASTANSAFAATLNVSESVLQPRSHMRRGVFWDKKDAKTCATRRCFSKSLWRYATFKAPVSQVRQLEDYVRKKLREGYDEYWHTVDDLKQVEDVLARSSCSVVGGAPIVGDRFVRSADIDRQDIVIRANLNLPLQHSSSSKKLPAAHGSVIPHTEANISASLGLGTKTNILFINYIALRRADCFVDIPDNLKNYLENVHLVLHMHRWHEVVSYLHCRKRLQESNSTIQILPLHPAVRVMNARLLARAAFGNRPPGKRFVPFATTGLSMLTSALSLCKSVHAFGFTGLHNVSYTNSAYATTGGHNIKLERSLMQNIRECRVLQLDGLCEKFISLQ